MKKQRKSYTAAFKAKVALEAIKGQRTTNEIASAYEVHPNQVTQWKKQAVSQLSEIFSNGRVRADAAEEALHPLRRGGGEEIPDVQPHHDGLARVIERVGDDRLAALEAVHRGMRQEQRQQPAENAPLNLLERRIGGEDRPPSSAALGDDELPVAHLDDGAPIRSSPGAGPARPGRVVPLSSS